MGIVENWKNNHEWIIYYTGVFIIALITEFSAASAVLLVIGNHNTWMGLFTVIIGQSAMWLIACIGLLMVRPKGEPPVILPVPEPTPEP